MLKISPILRLYRSNSSSIIQRCTQIQMISTRNLTSGDNHHDYLSPYVQLPYSYAFGRSQGNVIYKTLGQLMDERAEKDSGRPFIVSHHENIKKYFGEFYEEINHLVMAMHDHLNIRRGDVVGIWSSNVYDWIVIQYACLRLGAILCTANPFYQSHELDYAIRKGEMKALFMPGKQSKQNEVNDFFKIIRETLRNKSENEELPLHLKNIITIDGERYDENDFPSNLQIKTFELYKLKQYKAELDRSIIEAVLPDDPAKIVFTSGTTGRPKGACLSHFTLANNVSLIMRQFEINGEANCCLPLPFFHSFAGVLGNLMPLAFPESQIVIPFLKYNLRDFVECIQKHNVTFLFATPTLAIDLFNYVSRKNHQLPTLKAVLAGGAAVPEETVYQFKATVPSCTDFRIGYGATETGPGLSGNRTDSSDVDKAQTVGQPIDFVEVKIVNPETKHLVKIGETGELHTRGHHVMISYWKEPEKTAKVLQNGWYNTEDLATMDERGYIKIVGRTKEMVIVGGENVYPREIEEVLHMLPSIEIASVVGVPDERRGEELCAWIKYREGVPEQSHEELQEFCKQKLAYFKVPKYFLTVDDFPMTPTRKQQKYLMRDISVEKLKLKKSTKK
ncbi:acyl-coa synthetase-like protein [Dermatophagoides farinae]|uniref:Medium-chain acyl-CoA ligase ACSF2, mitochondrial n=1 Tax=Dermatophagoides farinae TaxID=6954 RepID=A0A9D4P3E3_DERFA|nr:putative acyl-CoA synthetase YngI [Dermatophagoides farinae]KAH7644006.1 acyl-coa synthetase-like protein [Dermatophagoides farinae]